MNLRLVSLAARSLALVVSVLLVSAARAEEPAVAGHEGAPAHHGHIGHDKASSDLEDPMGFRTDQTLFTLAVFFVLLAVLWKFAWGPIEASLEKRENKIAGDIAGAERANQEAKDLLAQYELKLQSAANEVRALMEEARREAEHAKQEIVAEGRREAEADRSRSLHDIETATDAALKNIAERGADLAVGLAGHIIKAKLNPEEQARLVKEAMVHFPDVTPSRS